MSPLDEQLADERRADEQRSHYLSLAAAGPSVKANRAAKPRKRHQQNGDRGTVDDDDDDAGDAKLPVYCRFADLTEAGITDNWPHLLRLIDNEGFPTGIMLSRNIRAWPVDEVKRWLAERPTARKKIVRPYKQKEAATA